MAQRGIETARRVCLLSWVLIAALGVAGCTTKSGRAESSSETPGPIVEHADTPPPGASSVNGESPTPPLAPANPNLPPPKVPVAYPRTIEESGANRAVLSLYKQAQQLRAANHPEQALDLLDRAQHLAPRNPFLWQALALTHLDLKQPDEAEGKARRSSSLGRGNPYLDAGNWRIVATARQAQGDSDGAREAQAHADQAAQAISAPP